MHMKIIVGLGTAEEHSYFNRVNIGVLIIDYLVETYNISITNEPLFNMNIGMGDILGEQVVLIKATSNNIWNNVIECMHHFNASFNEILVICGDVNLSFDKILFRQCGFSDTPKEFLNPISSHSTFPILKYGIGPCQKDIPILDYIHSDFSKLEKQLIQDRLPCLRLPIEMFVWRGIVSVMNTFN